MLGLHVMKQQRVVVEAAPLHGGHESEWQVADST